MNLNVLAISDGPNCSSTFNLLGIQKQSVNNIIVRQFNAPKKEYDWANLVYVHYGGIGEWKDLQKTLRERQDKIWIIGVRGWGNFKKCFRGKGRGPDYEPSQFVRDYFKAYSVSSKEMQTQVEKYGGKPVYLCQAGVDTKRFTLQRNVIPEQFCMGWVGNPWTGAKRFGRFPELPFPLRICGATINFLKEKNFPLDQLLNNGGWIDHTKIHEFYPTISVYVSLSDNEGCPMPPLEAAASGRPVVATAVGALKEWMPPEYLVPMDKYTDLIPLIARFRDDEELWRKECVRFRRISLDWDFKVIAKQYDYMFREVYETNI